jgi:pimeloyl-ACP methyl ester carboxylesterase
MGGIAALAFAARNPELARAIVVIDVAVVSTRRRDRYVQRLRALPTVIYRDLTTAKERYRLVPNEGEIAPRGACRARRAEFRAGSGWRLHAQIRS